MRDQSADLITASTIDLVKQLIDSSSEVRSRKDKANRKRFAKMMSHPDAATLTMKLTDNVIRISGDKQSSQSLRNVVRHASVAGIGLFDYLAINLAAFTSVVAPRLVMRTVRWRIHQAAIGIILPAERDSLRTHIARRSAQHARLNVNVLGEAILGDAEALARCASIMDMIERPEVDYISVKISAIVCNIVTVDHEGSVRRVTERLRDIYRLAQRHHTFVNLDMEEFRDLAITVDVFTRLLDEPEFERMNAGIVLQAYLPDSHLVLDRLIAWARKRYTRAGGAIKIRIVKGANLAMEHVDAEMHGFTSAPYSTKAHVDASYLKMLDVLIRPENLGAIRIGVASHNLFHLAWTLKLAGIRNVQNILDIEMLEGMANAEAQAVTQVCGSVLLYTPITYKDDFPSAVAYLVRRLDENTAAENYLRASFTMTSSSLEFDDQRARFIAALSERHDISTVSRRHSATLVSEALNFRNSPDGDATNPRYREHIVEALINTCAQRSMHVPSGASSGDTPTAADSEQGLDPNDNGRVWYTYSIATPQQIDQVVATADAGLKKWGDLGAQTRGQILRRAADLIAQKREEIISIMARDAGKTVGEADPEVSEAIDFANFYAQAGAQIPPGSQPLGPILIVPPWNFPYAIPLGGVCAALSAGNTVILKPAPETVATARHIVECLWAAGVPHEVLQFLPCRDDETGKHLVTHPGIAAVVLTGAFETATMFTEWKPDLYLLAETSGKNAIVVTASADIDSAVKDIVQSAFGHAGQKCSAASLAIVDEEIYDNPAFLRQLTDAVQSLVIGSGTNLGTMVGPLIRPPNSQLLRALTTLDAHESWLVQPEQRDAQGYLWSAGIKLGVQPGSWSHLNEWFGPVLGIMKSPDLETSVKWQNAIPYGLTAGISSLDSGECEFWIDSVQAGNLYVNRSITGAVVGRQPFGGWRRSSVGPTAKAGGPHYVEQLRLWSPLTDHHTFISHGTAWMTSTGRVTHATSSLRSELNYLRYRPYQGGIVARLDDQSDSATQAVLTWLDSLPEVTVHLSQSESINELLHRIASGRLVVEKVRWLSAQPAPVKELLSLGVSLDPRPIANIPEIEIPRWLHEQSIAITHHRHGNIGAGPEISIL